MHDASLASGGTERPNLKTMVEDYERRLIEAALRATGGNQRRAAAQLGLLPTTLHEKMKRLGLLQRGLPEASVAPRTADFT